MIVILNPTVEGGLVIELEAIERDYSIATIRFLIDILEENGCETDELSELLGHLIDESRVIH